MRLLNVVIVGAKNIQSRLIAGALQGVEPASE